MTKAPFDTGDSSARERQQSTSDSGFALALFVFAVAMLALFTVLALADVVGLGRILPFFTLPLALLVVAAILVWHWLIGEAKVSLASEVADPQPTQGKRR